MVKLIGKGKYTVNGGNHTHTSTISKLETMRRVQMQKMGTASEIKRAAT